MTRVTLFFFTIALASMSLADVPPPTAEGAINRGLSFLAKQQNHDHSFGADNARLLATSRAVLIFLQVGNVPDSGRYGFAVKAAEDWMLAAALPSGGFAGNDGRTRPQAAAVLALAELYGAESNPERRTRLSVALRSAVGPLLALQVPMQTPPTPDIGGWGDQKNATPSLSLTAAAALALSNARDVGIAIPPVTLEQAKRYILSCNDLASGGFSPQRGKAASIDATSAALVALDVLSPNGDDADRAAAATKYLESQTEPGAMPSGYLGAAWVCWCDARLQLSATAKFRDAFVQHLISTQGAEGAWDRPGAEKQSVSPPTRLAITELALLGLTAQFRSTPVLRH